MFRRLTLGTKVSLGISVVLIVILLGRAAMVVMSERAFFEESVARNAEAPLTMLAAMHTQAMLNRLSLEQLIRSRATETQAADGAETPDADDPAVATLDGTFKQLSETQKNIELWLVMGPKVIAYQRAKGEGTEEAHDAVDEEAIRTGRKVARMNGRETYRLSRPVILGQDVGNHEKCFACHQQEMGDQPGAVLGAFAVAYDTSEEWAKFVDTAREAVISAIVVSLIISTAGFLMVRMLAGRPIAAIAGVMDRLARGDHGVDIPAQEREDEIGSMARAVQVFKDNALKLAEMRAQQEAAEHQAQEDRRRILNQMADALESKVKGAIGQVSENAERIIKTTTGMGAKIDSSTSRSLEVAEASGRTTENVAAVVAAAEELASSIAEIGKQVTRASDVARNAVEDAARTNTTVAGLAEAVQRIGEVVELITEIADQTNLLALNATIEAARAGDAGKGFAVVASEVKNLASQTAKATEQIGSQIQEIQGATGKAVIAIEGIGKVIGDISEIAAAIAAAVEEQSAATQEIVRSVTDVETDAKKVAGSITEVTRSSVASYGSAIRVLWAAGDLSAPARNLDDEINAFLGNIRS